jgi:hypothetical protein
MVPPPLAANSPGPFPFLPNAVVFVPVALKSAKRPFSSSNRAIVPSENTKNFDT